MQSPNYALLAASLLEWQGFKQFYARSSIRAAPNWDAAYRILQSAKALDDYAREHLQEALRSSDDRLVPLCDPQRLNVGSHRWLSTDREESYSDWLAWILQQFEAQAIFSTFGLINNAALSKSVKSIRREETGEEGRTDIEIWFGDPSSLLLLEVKTKPVSDELPAQLARYQRRTERYVAEGLLKEGQVFLVVLTGEGPELPGNPEWRSLSWRTVCQRLRRQARTWLSPGVYLLRAASVLNFCGAVEQNLLLVSATPGKLGAMRSIAYFNSWGDEG